MMRHYEGNRTGNGDFQKVHEFLVKTGRADYTYGRFDDQTKKIPDPNLPEGCSFTDLAAEEDYEKYLYCLFQGLRQVLYGYFT